MKICVLGVGYIGLPTSAILANNGHNVIGVDINIDYIRKLNSRTFKTKESQLYDLVNNAMDKNQLKFTTKPEKSDVFIICVPTPLNNDRSPDLNHITEAIDGVIDLLERDNLIIVESTIPPGTIKEFIKPLIERSGLKVGEDIYLAYCPERVLPGNIVFELINNPRVIGGFTNLCAIKAKEVYSSFVKGEIYLDKIENVEMTKLVENAFRDINLAFAYELALFCDDIGLNAFEIIDLANLHPRVSILTPGVGVGGHCIPVDSYFLIDKNSEYTSLLSTTRSINEKIPDYVFNKIYNLLKDIENPKVALWGISYKADSDDIRNSPAIEVYRRLIDNGIMVRVYDPLVYGHDKNYGIDTVVDVDLLVLLVEHSDFHSIDYQDIISKMKRPMVFDGINMIKNGNLQGFKICKLYGGGTDD